MATNKIEYVGIIAADFEQIYGYNVHSGLHKS